jgi:hypothetical protein
MLMAPAFSIVHLQETGNTLGYCRETEHHFAESLGKEENHP